jgi:hypothetical protein
MNTKRRPRLPIDHGPAPVLRTPVISHAEVLRILADKPPRGAFDYLLEPNRDEVPKAPPPPPPQRGGPRRVRVEIEINQRAPTKPRVRFGVIGWVFIAAGILALAVGCAHAQSFQQYRLGGTTYYQGTTPDNQSWSGSSYELGGTTYSDFTGPRGEMQHCSSYRLGGTVYTDCNR